MHKKKSTMYSCNNNYGSIGFFIDQWCNIFDIRYLIRIENRIKLDSKKKYINLTRFLIFHKIFFHKKCFATLMFYTTWEQSQCYAPHSKNRRLEKISVTTKQFLSMNNVAIKISSRQLSSSGKFIDISEAWKVLSPKKWNWIPEKLA